MALEGKKILVTGGLGYIGSHTALVLLEAGSSVVLLDNLSNTYLKVLEHVKRLAKDKAPRVSFVKCDIRDAEGLREILQEHKFDATIHFAGFKAVGESVEQPLLYYDNNFVGTVVLLKELAAVGCKNLVFSSSCTVYGIPDKVPLTETSPLHAVSPYGRTKLFQEIMFRDLCKSDDDWRVMLLRYFNPVGAHPSGELGEHPVGIPNNLMPYVQQVTLGQREYLRIFGSDYDTPDGTAVRDYVHVVDIADGHVAAVRKLLDTPKYGCHAINLGTGKGTSVLEMVSAFEKASSRKVPYKLVERRPGDSTTVWASTETARRELGWVAKYDVFDMCTHQWAWASNYPTGYDYNETANGNSTKSRHGK